MGQLNRDPVTSRRRPGGSTRCSGFRGIGDATPERVRVTLTAVVAKKNLKGRTANGYRIALSGFFSWLVKENRWATNPLRSVPRARGRSRDPETGVRGAGVHSLPLGRPLRARGRLRARRDHGIPSPGTEHAAVGSDRLRRADDHRAQPKHEEPEDRGPPGLRHRDRHAP